MSDPSPQAKRLASPRWLDGRFLLGVVVIVIPIVVGAHLLASADRYAEVYVARHSLVPGEHLQVADLSVGRVRFDGQGDRYVAAGRVPAGYLVTRYVAAGEIVPLTALTASTTAVRDSRVVTLPVGMGHAPLDLARGQLVDVYVTAKEATTAKRSAPRLVIGSVPVDAVSGGGSLSSSNTVSVMLVVPAEQVQIVVSALETGVIDVVRVPDAVAATAVHAHPTVGPSTTSPAAPAGAQTTTSTP